VQDTWLSRLRDAQTAFRQAYKRADGFLHGFSATSVIASDSAAGEQASVSVAAPRSARRRAPHQGRGGGGGGAGGRAIDASSSSAVDSDAPPVADRTTAELRRSNSRAVRSSSSDAATSTDAEVPPRPVSPRRISDPICQHSDAQVHADDGSAPSVPPPVPSRVPPRSITTVVQMHRETTAFECAPPSPGLPDESHARSDNGRGSRHHCWRVPRRQLSVDLQQQQQQQHRGATSSLSLGSLHHQRLGGSSSAAAVAQSPTAARPPPPGEPWRGSVPVSGGHLLYRGGPMACRSETASPVIDDDDDDDEEMARDRHHPTSWLVRRHLKAISERSHSSDTIYV